VKKLFILFAFALIISACNKDSSSSTDTSFRIKSGSLKKFDSPVPGTGTNCTIGGSVKGGYAIIYSGTIENNNRVGIACSNNPKYPENPTSETYNLKIYYTGPIESGIYSVRLIQNDNGSLTDVTENNLALTITALTPVTTDNYTYYPYTISGTSTNIGSINITAVLHP
jgi:hypothetical protein